MKLLENAALATYARTRAGFLQVLFGLHRKEEARALATALEALRRVGLGELAWERADRLTAGQQRLLELARLLASGAEVLLLDEPGAGLRAGEKRELAKLLLALAREGYSVLLVDHDMDLVMGLADRVVVMNYGESSPSVGPSWPGPASSSWTSLPWASRPSSSRRSSAPWPPSDRKSTRLNSSHSSVSRMPSSA